MIHLEQCSVKLEADQEAAAAADQAPDNWTRKHHVKTPNDTTQCHPNVADNKANTADYTVGAFLLAMTPCCTTLSGFDAVGFGVMK